MRLTRTAALQPIKEWQANDLDSFDEQVVATDQPAIIRSLVSDWPAVVASKSSATEICHYLRNFDKGQAVYTIAAPPEADGRFFYNNDLRSVNFKRGQIPLAQVLAQLVASVDATDAHAIAVQALAVRQCLPDFDTDNSMSLLPIDVEPTMWIGTRGRVSPHYDVHKNLACVVAGRRRFTLFPPQQIANLCPGPVLDAPGGVPTSLVDVDAPDLDRFPRYTTALEHAQQATLDPGDAIFIPSLWWHGVAALEPVNVLVNYWWGGDAEAGISANDTLLHGMLTIAALEPAQRDAWKQFFDYYVFGGEIDPAAHLPDELPDIVTNLTDEQLASVKRFLAQRLAD